jgi:hypothetical protein
MVTLGYKIDKDGVLVSTVPLRWKIFTVAVVFFMGRVAFCSDRYTLTTVLIEAPAAADLAIDGRPLRRCKDELDGAVGCRLDDYDGVRVYQWRLRSSMTATLVADLDGRTGRMEITGEAPEFLRGYSVQDGREGLTIAEVDPSALQ